jgi:predicted transcriptional regulator
MKIGAFVRKKRKEVDVSSMELAIALGISQIQMLRYERDKSEFSARKWLKVKDYLGISDEEERQLTN